MHNIDGENKSNERHWEAVTAGWDRFFLWTTKDPWKFLFLGMLRLHFVSENLRCLGHHHHLPSFES
jgi:hypothetical protein